MVRQWELVQFGPATKTLARRGLGELSPAEIALRDKARASLLYPPVQFTGVQARAIAQGFKTAQRAGGYTIWALAIMPEHTHIVVARHRYKIEQIANLLKGASTRHLESEDLHPLSAYRTRTGRPPKMWGRNQWKVYLDSEEAIEAAIAYVELNPEREGKRPQRWSCVTPFTGLPKGWMNYHE
jgi:REP element-mobilizing transposase RayT